MPDTVNMHIIKNKIEKAGALHRTILGEHFREEYRKTYDIPTLDLSTYRGGMTPLKRGGGNQTNSLRLEDSQGRQYAMRDMTKDASRLLPKNMLKIKSSRQYPILRRIQVLKDVKPGL